MRSKVARKILEETSQETKDKVLEYADNLVSGRKWRYKTGFECDNCGDDYILIYTSDESKDMCYDGDDVKCGTCDYKGSIVVSEEPYAFIDWDEEY